MAFKTRDPNETPEQREASNQATVRMANDRSAFGSACASGTDALDAISVKMVDVRGFDMHQTTFLVRDKEGMFEVALLWDRKLSGDTLNNQEWSKVGHALRAQHEDPRERAGLDLDAAGRFGRFIGNRWSAEEQGFRGRRGFAIASGAVHLPDGGRIEVGRPMAYTEALVKKTEPILRGGEAAGGEVSAAGAAGLAVDSGKTATDAISPNAASAARDADTFKGKPTRAAAFQALGEPPLVDIHGNLCIPVSNEKGRVTLIVPSDRADAWRGAEGGSLDAFQEALRTTAQGGRPLPVSATGAFVKETSEVGDVARAHWQFRAATLSFEAAGQVHQVGWPVVQAAPAQQTQDSPAPSKAARVGRGGEAR